MSMTKRWLETQEAMHQAATEVAIRAGLLNRCDLCEGVYDSYGNDVEAAYKLGNSLITQGDEEVAIFEGDRVALTDMLKEIANEYGDECGCKARFRHYMGKD